MQGTRFNINQLTKLVTQTTVYFEKLTISLQVKNFPLSNKLTFHTISTKVEKYYTEVLIVFRCIPCLFKKLFNSILIFVPMSQQAFQVPQLIFSLHFSYSPYMLQLIES